MKWNDFLSEVGRLDRKIQSLQEQLQKAEGFETSLSREYGGKAMTGNWMLRCWDDFTGKQVYLDISQEIMLKAVNDSKCQLQEEIRKIEAELGILTKKQANEEKTAEEVEIAESEE